MTKKLAETDRPVSQVPLKQVLVTERLRSADDEWVEILAGSMLALGQLQPVIVLAADEDGQHRLVAGLHRCEAAGRLGWSGIAAIIVSCGYEEALQIEADENLVRRELSALDKAVSLAAAKERYEAAFPETRHGAQGGRGGARNEKGIMPFSKKMAEKSGVDVSTIKRSVRIAALSTAERDALKDHSIARNQAQLLKLVKLPPEQREKAVAALTREEAPAKTVQEAVEATAGRVKTKERPAHQKQYDALCRAFDGANARAKKLFIAWLHENGALASAIAAAKAEEVE